MKAKDLLGQALKSEITISYIEDSDDDLQSLLLKSQGEERGASDRVAGHWRCYSDLDLSSEEKKIWQVGYATGWQKADKKLLVR